MSNLVHAGHSELKELWLKNNEVKYYKISMMP
jgi:hypothetical protein